MTGTERALSARSNARRPEAVEPRHHHIGEDEIRRRRLRAFQRGAPVARDLDDVELAENSRQVVAHVGVVVGDEQPGTSVRRHRRRSGEIVERERRGRRIRVRQPAQGFFDVWDGAGARRRLLAGGNPLGRQVRRAGPHADGERRAFTLATVDGDRPSVQAGQLLDQREPDAGPFVRPRPRVLHAVKALEHSWKIGRGNADSRIAHHEVDAIAAPHEAHADSTERELERVGKEIQDDLPPTCHDRRRRGREAADSRQ
jgi:hypothetical protein